MKAVGRIAGYISKSVYTVSGPFHPFGGAVDIIVVEQQDGSFKSSPWYVSFGKFQGVLKAKEKAVSISVNGVEADFNMYLDYKGEAYFLREMDSKADTANQQSKSVRTAEDAGTVDELKYKLNYLVAGWLHFFSNLLKGLPKLRQAKGKLRPSSRHLSS